MGPRKSEPGAGYVADGPAADIHFYHLFFRPAGDEGRIGGKPLAVALEYLAAVREIERRHLNAFLVNVLPDIHFRPVADGEDAEMLAHIFLGIVDVPELRPLVLGVPLAKFIAVGEDALFGARALLVPSAAAEGGLKAIPV